MKYFTCPFVLSLLNLGCILLSEAIPGPSSHFSRLKAPWCWQLCMGWAGVLGSFLSDGHYYEWSTSPYPQGDGHADMVLCSSEASLDRLHLQSVHGHKWLLSSYPSPDEGSISFLNKPVVQFPWPDWCGSFSMETPTHPSDADQGHLLGKMLCQSWGDIVLSKTGCPISSPLCSFCDMVRTILLGSGGLHLSPWIWASLTHWPTGRNDLCLLLRWGMKVM